MMRRWLKWMGILSGLFVVGAAGYLYLSVRHVDRIFNPPVKERQRDKV